MIIAVGYSCLSGPPAFVRVVVVLLRIFFGLVRRSCVLMLRCAYVKVVSVKSGCWC